MKREKNTKPKRFVRNTNDLTIQEFRELTGIPEEQTSDEEAQKIMDGLKTFSRIVYGMNTGKLDIEKKDK